MSHAQLDELSNGELRALLTLLEQESRLTDEQSSAHRKIKRVLAIRLLAAERLGRELAGQ